jgi:hypothetical protein
MTNGENSLALTKLIDGYSILFKYELKPFQLLDLILRGGIIPRDTFGIPFVTCEKNEYWLVRFQQELADYQRKQQLCNDDCQLRAKALSDYELKYLLNCPIGTFSGIAAYYEGEEDVPSWFDTSLENIITYCDKAKEDIKKGIIHCEIEIKTLKETTTSLENWKDIDLDKVIILKTNDQPHIRELLRNLQQAFYDEDQADKICTPPNNESKEILKKQDDKQPVLKKEEIVIDKSKTNFKNSSASIKTTAATVKKQENTAERWAKYLGVAVSLAVQCAQEEKPKSTIQHQKIWNKKWVELFVSDPKLKAQLTSNKSSDETGNYFREAFRAFRNGLPEGLKMGAEDK